MCTNGAWGTVCLNSYWNNNDANVACHELGHSAYGLFNDIFIIMYISIIYIYLKSSFISVMSVGNTYENGWTEEKYPIIFTRFDCSGSETRLSSCSSSVTSNIQYCSNNQVVNLTCEGQYHFKFCF